MRLLSQKLTFSDSKPSLPEGFSKEIYEIARKVTSSELAGQVLEKIEPILGDYRADKKLALACGLLCFRKLKGAEIRRMSEDLIKLVPDDPTGIQFLMRWYRRHGNVEDGVSHIHELCSDWPTSSVAARNLVIGLTELHAWREIASIMQPLIADHANDRALKMALIKALNKQRRFREAAELACQVQDRGKMGVASQDLLATVERKARTLAMYGRSRPEDLIPEIVARSGRPRALGNVERVVFFTGQLGTGGAERQLTRIACAYQQRAAAGFGPQPQVWVRHATSEKGADFYLPTLRAQGVVTRILSEEREMPVDSLEGVPPSLRDMLDLLPRDLTRNLGRLTTMFLQHRPDVAYLWQDGGILQAALAALIAGVPRIVTSFRGLPPNLRKHLYRDELPLLYKALARLDHVTFTANSKNTATAYEQWLSLPKGTVIVVPNAVPEVLSFGAESDKQLWSAIIDASATCTRTVLGVFRFDGNKRPLEWIKAAARYLAKHDDTRFVMLGGGDLAGASAEMIAELGLANRIFLIGVRSNVGFYMHRADLVMHLACMEGLPNVLIEAQLAGTAVLATPAGGTDEVVQHGVTGILLSQADVLPEEELDRELRSLLSDKPTLVQLGAAGAAHSSSRFSLHEVLGQTDDLFAGIIRGRNDIRAPTTGKHHRSKITSANCHVQAA